MNFYQYNLCNFESRIKFAGIKTILKRLLHIVLLLELLQSNYYKLTTNNFFSIFFQNMNDYYVFFDGWRAEKLNLFLKKSRQFPSLSLQCYIVWEIQWVLRKHFWIILRQYKTFQWDNDTTHSNWFGVVSVSFGSLDTNTEGCPEVLKKEALHDAGTLRKFCL